jgi:hypothetical protein
MYSCSTLPDNSKARLRASSRDNSLVGVDMARDFGLLRFGVTENNRSEQTDTQADYGTTAHFVDNASVNMSQFKLTGGACGSSPTAHIHSMAPLIW